MCFDQSKAVGKNVSKYKNFKLCIPPLIVELNKSKTNSIGRK